MAIEAYWADGDPRQGVNNFGVGMTVMKSTRLGPNSWSAKEFYFSTFDNQPVNPPGYDPDFPCTGFSGYPVAITEGSLVMLWDATSGSNAQRLYYFTGSGVPVPIDAVNLPVTQWFFGRSAGPWKFGGALWVICPVITASPTIAAVQVYKSSDNGATWTAQDTAHAPQALADASSPNTNIQPAPVNWDYYWDGTSHLLRLVYSPDGALNWFIEFDMNAGTWTAAHDSFDPTTLTPSAGTEMQGLVVDKNGKYTLFMVQSSGAGPVAFPWTGTFGHGYSLVSNITDADVTPLYYLTQVLLDPDGTTLHLFLNYQAVSPNNLGQTLDPGFQQVFYQRVVGDALTAVFHEFPFTALFNLHFAPAFVVGNNITGKSVIDGNAILFGHAHVSGLVIPGPLPTVLTNSQGYVIQWPTVWVGSPVSNPVWSEEFVDQETGASGDDAFPPFLVSNTAPSTPKKIVAYLVGKQLFPCS